MSQRRVLAVNHVFEILLHFAGAGDWTQAILHAMPKRRGAQEPGDEREPGGEREPGAQGGEAESAESRAKGVEEQH